MQKKLLKFWLFNIRYRYFQILGSTFLFWQVKLRRIIGTQSAVFKESTRIVEATREGTSVFSVNSGFILVCSRSTLVLSVLFALYYLRKFTKRTFMHFMICLSNSPHGS